MDKRIRGVSRPIMAAAASLCLAASGCGKAVVRGEVPFGSEPISSVHLDRAWGNRTGQPINGTVQGILDEALFDLTASSTLNLGQAKNAAGETRDMGIGFRPWLERKLGLPMVEKAGPETLVVKPVLVKTDLQATVLAVEVGHGAKRTKLGEVECEDPQPVVGCLDPSGQSIYHSTKVECDVSRRAWRQYSHSTLRGCLKAAVAQIATQLKQ